MSKTARKRNATSELRNTKKKPLQAGFVDQPPAFSPQRLSDLKRKTFIAPGGQAVVPDLIALDGNAGDPPPNPIGRDDSGEPLVLAGERVQQIIADYFAPFAASTITQRLIVADKVYFCVNWSFVLQVANTDPWLAPSVYRDDVFDCDDYVQLLRVRMAQFAQQRQYLHPFTVGYVLTRLHAFNLILTPTGHIVVLDTQIRQHGMTADPAQFGQFMAITPDNKIQHIYM